MPLARAARAHAPCDAGREVRPTGGPPAARGRPRSSARHRQLRNGRSPRSPGGSTAPSWPPNLDDPRADPVDHRPGGGTAAELDRFGPAIRRGRWRSAHRLWRDGRRRRLDGPGRHAGLSRRLPGAHSAWRHFSADRPSPWLLLGLRPAWSAVRTRHDRCRSVPRRASRNVQSGSRRTGSASRLAAPGCRVRLRCAAPRPVRRHLLSGRGLRRCAASPCDGEEERAWHGRLRRRDEAPGMGASC